MAAFAVLVARTPLHYHQYSIRQRPVQRLCLSPRRAHPDIALLIGCQDHRHGPSGSLPLIEGSQPDPFINIKFHGSPFAKGAGGELCPDHRFEFSTGKASDMKKAILALVTAATFGMTALMAPSPAQAWRGGWGPGLAGGLIAGAVIGGIASSAYAYGPGYGYYGGPGYGYGGYAPAYYGGYAPAYYGGYAPAYYGPRYRRVIRPLYAYGPRYYGGYGW
jgi:hypothetical protein